MDALMGIEAQALTCLRGGRVVFRDLSFQVEAGEVLAIEGANGAGKTSLLRMVAGFLVPAAGAIRLRTKSGGQIFYDDERGKFAGWLGHHDAAKPQLTARETLIFFARLYDVDEPAEPALEEAGLARAADLPCQFLSAGQKKRLALARLKLCQRPLWLLDEPLAALDANGKIFAASLIAAHCALGGIALIATHEALGLDCTKLALA
ncbi:MAG TPA: heme ABC exporter ATP-binding protein CcmA [Rhizomicrobium sp.]